MVFDDVSNRVANLNTVHDLHLHDFTNDWLMVYSCIIKCCLGPDSETDTRRGRYRSAFKMAPATAISSWETFFATAPTAAPKHTRNDNIYETNTVSSV